MLLELTYLAASLRDHQNLFFCAMPIWIFTLTSTDLQFCLLWGLWSALTVVRQYPEVSALWEVKQSPKVLYSACSNLCHSKGPTLLSLKYHWPGTTLWKPVVWFITWLFPNITLLNQRNIPLNLKKFMVFMQQQILHPAEFYVLGFADVFSFISHTARREWGNTRRTLNTSTPLSWDLVQA